MCRTVLCVLVLTTTFTLNHAWEQVEFNPKHPPLLRMGNVARFNCKHQICDYVEDYPEDEINLAMESQQTLKSLVSGFVYNSSADSILVKTRVNFNEFSMVQFCNVGSSTIHAPQMLRNMDNAWKVVVNTKQYQQRISVETCRTQPGQNRDYCTEEGMSCMQNFQDLSLVIYDEGEIKFDRFPIPTNCQCTRPTC